MAIKRVKADTPTTDEELRETVAELIEYIAQSVEEPCNWPLTPVEQAQFIRRVGHKAIRIRNSEPFLRSRIVEAKRKLSASSVPSVVQSGSPAL